MSPCADEVWPGCTHCACVTPCTEFHPPATKPPQGSTSVRRSGCLSDPLAHICPSEDSRGCGRTHALGYGACGGNHSSVSVRSVALLVPPPPWRAAAARTPCQPAGLPNVGAVQEHDTPADKACPGPVELSVQSGCRYFTLLREPIARAVSSYDYFCQGCAEHSRFCSGGDPDRDQELVAESVQVKKNGTPRKTPAVVPPWVGRQGHSMGLSCPDMSLLEWTRAWGNLYVSELSGYNLELAAANPTTAAAEWCSADHWARNMHLGLREMCPRHAAAGDTNLVHQLETASRRLRTREVVVTTLGDSGIDYKTLRNEGVPVADRCIGNQPPKANAAHKPHDKLSPDVLAELKSILKYDIALFEMAKSLSLTED